MLQRKKFRMVVELVVGFILSFGFNFIMISIGYATLYSHKLNEYMVNVAGIAIYHITDGGEKGIAINSGMMLVGIIFVIFFVIIVEFIVAQRQKRKIIK